MLQFILGRCGVGKSAYLRNILKEKLNQGLNKIILIVPEQSSFSNERRMLEYLGNINFNKINVLSFSRLYDFVSKVLNIPIKKTDSNIAQTILMNLAIENVKDSLKLYKKSSSNSEIAQLMLHILKEFKSYKINMETLDNIANLTDKDIIKQKISEIKLIINSYENLSKNNFENSIDNLNRLENILKNNNIFEGYNIFFDEFSSFTPQQLSILKILAKQAQNTYITLCCDKIPQKSDIQEKNLFSCVYNTFFKISEMAQKQSIKINDPIVLEKTSRFENEELQTLEKNLFNPQKKQFNAPNSCIGLYNALTTIEECEQIAKTIRKLVIEQNYRYRDFAVLTRNIENYSEKLKNVFKQYEIPYFLNTPSKIHNKSTSVLVLSALDIINSNYDSSTVLRFLKTGLTDLSTEDIFEVENYVFLWNISGKEWLQEFTMHPEGFSKTFEENHLEKLKRLNELRGKIILPLENFKNKIKQKNYNGKAISEAIFELLMQVNAPCNLKNICSKLIAENRIFEAEQEAKVWDYIMNALSEISAFLCNTKISVKKYSEILLSVIGSINFSSIPQSVDNVVIGASNLVRLSSPKVVFILGAVNGEFPKIPTQSEIFTDYEINHISSLGTDITNNNENFLIEERFLAYMALTNASQKLFISWPTSDSENSGNLPSEIIKEIKEIFPKIKIFNRYNYTLEETLWSEKPAFSDCAKNWNANYETINSLKNYFLNNKDYIHKCNSLNNMFKRKTLNFENPEISKSLFSKDIKLSASQLEKYYKCKFGYFCEYVLKAKPLKRAEFNSLEYGSLVHYVFEKLFKKYSKDELISSPKDLIQKSISEITETYVNKKLGGFENKNSRFVYIIEKLKKSLYLLANRFIEEFTQSSFVLSDLELEISSKSKVKPLCFELPDKNKILIEGKVDRVDIMKTPNGNYIRIIDYKTGNKEFKLSDVLYGLNMQMLIYLLTIQKNGSQKYENVIPAGILYFKALKPSADVQNKNDISKINLQIQKELKMNGLILDNISVVEGMEKSGKGMFIPAEIKDGKINSKSLTDLNELGVIAKYIEKLTIEMVENLKCGNINSEPIIQNGVSTCQYCEYFPICKYKKENFKKIISITDNKKVLEKMKECIEQKTKNKN